MGLLGRRAERALAIVRDMPPAMSLSSPWVTGSLEPIVWADIFGADALAAMTREQAQSVPAVARGVGLLTSTVARCALHGWRGEDRLEADPPWMYRSDTVISAYTRMQLTVDDLIYTGWSLWGVERGADGMPLRMDRVPRTWWEISPGGEILVESTPVDPSSVVLIPGPHDGILNFGRRTLTTAALLEEAVGNTARAPIPAIDLHQTSDVPIDEAELQGIIAKWVAARQGANGGVAYTNAALEAKVLGSPVENLLIEGRNASAVDVSRLLGMPAAMIDATNAGASLTYETIEGRLAQFLDYGVLAYMLPIAARLSMDDVMPRGQRAEFDTATLTTGLPSAVGPTTED